MKNFSSQTSSFIILVSAAFIGSILCYVLWTNLVSGGDIYYQAYNYGAYKALPKSKVAVVIPQAASQIPAVNTASWKTYTSNGLNISFKYNPSWRVLAPKKTNGYTVLQIDPGVKYYDINLYISQTGYYVLQGLPSTTDTIGGQPALNVSNALFGVNENNTYYTFDVGWSMSLVPQFDALVHSVTFIN